MTTGTLRRRSADAVAAAVDEEIGSTWRAMHRNRKAAVREPWMADWHRKRAVAFWDQLRMLLEIRRKGLR